MGGSEKSLSPDGSSEKALPTVEVLGEPPQWTPEFEKKLVRKIDLYLMPMIWLMNVMSWMDRANLGNANIAGLTADLKLSSTQFSLAIITYYLGYIVWVPVSTLILARTRPSFYLPGIMALWGVVTASVGAMSTYPQLVVSRLLLGMLESGLTPAASFLFSTWYLPKEMGKRTSFYQTSAQLGGAFGGIVAGGVMSNLEGAHGIRGWRWLFIIEGIVTIVVAAIAVFILPDYPNKSPRLTEEEQFVATTRLLRVGILVEHKDSKPRLSVWQTMISSIRNWRAWCIACGSAFISATLIMVYFYPVLVRGLGYTDPVKAQFMTVPIWTVGFVFTMLSGIIGDRYPPKRGLLIVGGLCGLSILSIITCFVFDFKARYVFLAFMAAGAWVGFAQCMAFIAEVLSDSLPEVRAFTIGMMSCAATTGNLYGAYIWPAENAPKHLLGFGMCAALGAVAAGLFTVLYVAEMRKRKRLGLPTH
ncbi:pantothenate transporter liz1 [Cercophora newfieldiana]|uniref:Pantothenate transporter liz1 n=1 Tax=Cercophora newfieldiana TaxID=92897 RepID=A0AA39XWZ8_9PEZI|nr:pantothenate transporter liz1 [Cercophora newfieldiana]